MNSDLTWTIVESPGDDQVQELRRHLIEYNVAHSSIASGQDLGVFVRTATGELIAGASGTLWGACLEIGFVWVADSLRGQGVGRQLLESIEAEAVRRGCRVAVLDTYTFQAPDFYAKLGYQVLCRVEGYPDGIEKVFLKKFLMDIQPKSH